MTPAPRSAVRRPNLSQKRNRETRDGNRPASVVSNPSERRPGSGETEGAVGESVALIGEVLAPRARSQAGNPPGLGSGLGSGEPRRVMTRASRCRRGGGGRGDRLGLGRPGAAELGRYRERSRRLVQCVEVGKAG